MSSRPLVLGVVPVGMASRGLAGAVLEDRADLILGTSLTAGATT